METTCSKLRTQLSVATIPKETVVPSGYNSQQKKLCRESWIEKLKDILTKADELLDLLIFPPHKLLLITGKEYVSFPQARTNLTGRELKTLLA